MLTIEQNAWRTVAQRLTEIPYVERFALVGGDFDVLVLTRTPDNNALREVVLERIQEVPGVRSSRTWLVFDETPGRGADWD
jgi:DNA-binding Lrp family transcriptional regulator